MNGGHTLAAKAESTDLLAKLFQLVDFQSVRFQIHEDTCLKRGEWLDLGEIALKPGQAEPGIDSERLARLAVEFGFFEWHCPSTTEIQSSTHAILNTAAAVSDEQRRKVNRGLDGIVNAVCRLGLLHPVFDSRSVEFMPFRRPTTVVTDTSAIIQGGLDFVVRFLYPMARVKVPAIAHMELLNSADNYMSLRRGASRNAPGRVLLEHSKSQGGQRALLRLELQAETEIERGRLGADPLRGVVQGESDSEDKNLKLSVVQRSFADRLIFETARQHASQSNLDHPVLMMTSDQGLARMTLAEGMQALFFDANKLERISDRCLTGTTFNPFSGELYSVALTDILWELATTFGAARFFHAERGVGVEVYAIGETFSWKPYHAKDDLLWLQTVGFNSPGYSSSPAATNATPAHKAAPAAARPVNVEKARREGSESPRGASYGGSYRFSVPRMLNFISALILKPALTTADARNALGLEKAAPIDDYKNFLVSGGFVEAVGETLTKTEKLDRLWTALKIGGLSEIQSLLMQVPSFARFMDFVKSGPKADLSEFKIAERSVSTYSALAQVSGAAVSIPDDGLYATPENPKPQAFADIALLEYERLSSGADDWVLTGAWLEALVKNHGIHPLVARSRLEEARTASLIERYTEGSTPDTRFSKHILYVLEFPEGKADLRAIGLYEGSFLIPGRGSVTIRLKKGKA